MLTILLAVGSVFVYGETTKTRPNKVTYALATVAAYVTTFVIHALLAAYFLGHVFRTMSEATSWDNTAQGILIVVTITTALLVAWLRAPHDRPLGERLKSSVRHPSVIGLVIAWVISVLTVIVYPLAIYMSWRYYVEWRDRGSKVCPRCAETVKAAALVCRHCGLEFEAGATPADSPTPA